MSLSMPCCTKGLHACRLLRSVGIPARSDRDCQVVGWKVYNLAQSQRGLSAAGQHSTANSTRELQLEWCAMQHAGQAEEEKCHKVTTCIYSIFTFCALTLHQYIAQSCIRQVFVQWCQVRRRLGFALCFGGHIDSSSGQSSVTQCGPARCKTSPRIASIY